MQSFTLPIGIDFGPLCSCAGIWRNNGVEIISYEGSNNVPNCIAFSGPELLIGYAAENHKRLNPENTIYGFNSIMGRRFNDPKITRLIRQSSLCIVNDSGRPKYQVNWEGKINYFAPEEVSAMVLDALKRNTENYLGTDVKHTVIAVPSYFNSSQKKAVKDAVNIAGLNMLRIISKPSALALTYCFQNNCFQEQKNLLLYNLGCETVEVSIVNINLESIETKAIAFDQGFGGNNFDERLIKHLKNELKRRFKSNYKSELEQKLQPIAQQAIHTLSFSEVAEIELDSNTNNLCINVSRCKFEELCSDLFRKILHPIKKALNDAKLLPNSIDDVILIGKSTRIPKVLNQIQDFFPDKTIAVHTNSEESVAYGAAIFASAILNRNPGPISLVNVTSLSLGVETASGEYSRLIHRNSKVPCKQTRTYTTDFDNQSTITLKVSEGERAEGFKNDELCIVKITQVPLLPAKRFEVNITFSLDENGILDITAEDNCSVLGLPKPVVVVEPNFEILPTGETVQMAAEEKVTSGNCLKIEVQNKSKGVKRKIST